MQKLLTIICLLCCTAGLNCQITTTHTIQHDGLEREYKIYVPDVYDGNTAVPLVFNLHGYTSSMTEQEVYGDFRSIADTANFILVHPNGILDGNGDRYWNAFSNMSEPDDIGFLTQLIEVMSAEYNINSDCVYSAGMSNGGFMSFELACEASDLFTAVASVTGSMEIFRPVSCNPTETVPAMQIHGTADVVVPYNGSAAYTSVENVIQHWVDENDANTTPTIIQVPDNDPNDGSTAEQHIYENGDGLSVVEHFKVINGGHTWPGSTINLPGAGSTNQDFDASVEIWRFFRQHCVSAPSSVKSVDSLQDNIRLYPNPAHDRLVMEHSIFEGNSSVVIFDAFGRAVHREQVTSNTHTMDISHFASGVYLVCVESDREVITKKIVKR